MSTIRVAAEDGIPFDAEVLVIDETRGLALLKVAGGNLKPLPLAEKIRSGPAMVACFAKASIFGSDTDQHMAAGAA